jgi:hypothetical protein
MHFKMLAQAALECSPRWDTSSRPFQLVISVTKPETEENERDHILEEIRRIAKESGQAPGQTLFARHTGIAAHQWRGKFWAGWGDALEHFHPDWNRSHARM